MLELLWVHDSVQAQSARTRPTRTVGAVAWSELCRFTLWDLFAASAPRDNGSPVSCPYTNRPMCQPPGDSMGENSAVITEPMLFT